jgi:putative transposase
MPLIARFGTLGRVRGAVPAAIRQRLGFHLAQLYRTRAQLRFAPGFHHIALPQQNGMVQRVIRMLKEQCVHRHRIQHASRVIGDWIRFYNDRRPHQALGMKTPAEAFALAA